jgi:hypothetical protein
MVVGGREAGKKNGITDIASWPKLQNRYEKRCKQPDKFAAEF